MDLGFFALSENRVMKDDPLHLEQKLYSELGSGCIFWGYLSLTDIQMPLLLKAVKGCQLLSLPLHNLFLFQREESKDSASIISLPTSKREAPITALARTSFVEDESAGSQNRQSEVTDGVFPETKVLSMKTEYSNLDKVWQDISFGWEFVPLSQFIAFLPYLGKIGSEVFRKLFFLKRLPPQI